MEKKSLSIYENVPNILGGGAFLVHNFVYQAPVNRRTQNPGLAEISACTRLLQNFCVDNVDHVIISIQIHVCLFFHRAAVACVGAFYEKMGRMLGSSFPETVNNLLKSLKSAEVSFEIFYICGLGSI